MSAEKTRRDVEENLVTRAWEDASFRKKLIADPKAVLAEQGFSVRDSVTISVLEETPDKVYVVIPRQPPSAKRGAELSDDALDSVSGGFFNASCFSCGGG